MCASVNYSPPLFFLSCFFVILSTFFPAFCFHLLYFGLYYDFCPPCFYLHFTSPFYLCLSLPFIFTKICLGVQPQNNGIPISFSTRFWLFSLRKRFMTFVSRLLHRTRCLLLDDTQSNWLYSMWISCCLRSLNYITLVIFSLHI